MSADTTRIADLPENITMQVNENRLRADGVNTSYTPMDVHPNPYGHPPPSTQSLPTPSSQQYIPSVQQTLPGRDIPQDMSQYTHDPQIQANYIPPIPEEAKRTTDYMRQYDEITSRKVESHMKDNEEKDKFDRLIEHGQIPILVSVLFFMFHMPTLDNYFKKYMSFMSIQDNDGHFNMSGLIMKSCVFGGLYYSLSRMIQFLSES